MPDFARADFGGARLCRADEFNSVALPLDNLIRQFIRRCGSSWKMDRQQFADFANRFDQRVVEFLVLKMLPHSIDNALPELLAAFFMNGLVAYHGKLMRSGRDEDEHGIALARFVHAESMEFFLGSNQWIGTQLAALNVNPDLTGGFRFRFPNRPNDSIVFEPTEKFLRSHLATSSNLPRLHQNCRLRH